MINKIQKIEFVKSDVFKDNSTLTFFQEDTLADKIPKIFFLVGDNGSGKTSILNMIYNGLSAANNQYIGTDLTLGTKSSINIFNGLDLLKYEAEETNSGILTRPNENFKIIFDEVNTKFKTEKITSTTALIADGEKSPKERNQSLEKVIPQMLVDIRQEDNEYKITYQEQNNGKNDPEYVPRLDRFTKAFNKIYAGEKKYKNNEKGDGEIKIIFTDKEGNNVDLNTFSTGEKQIIFRVGNLLKNLGNLDNAIILIDEPETSLHPRWQKKYIQFLLDIFEGLNIQFIIATHSPYILQGMKDSESVAIKIDRYKDGEIGEKIGYYPNSLKNPSINLINYLAYGIIDELLHIELWTALEKREKIKYLETSPGGRDTGYKVLSDFIKNSDSIIIKKGNEKLPVYIRNKIHHADNETRSFDEDELEKSINIMLDLLK